MASEEKLAYWLTIPALLVIFLIAFFPIFQAIWLSFHKIQLQFPQLGTPFVGLGNYQELFKEPRFWNAIKNTFVFASCTVILEFIFGLILALLLNKSFMGRGILRTALLIPWAFTTVVSALMWQFIYNDQFGILNSILMKLHIIKQPIIWLGTTKLAMISAIIADVWKTTPFMALLLLAGLQVIPREMYEAALIDGASAWQTFLRVTLPLLKPTILVALLFRTLDAVRVFDLIFVLTQGGPGNSTEVLSYLTYIKLFREFDFGVGSALSVITFLCIMGISMFFIKILGARTT